MQNAEAIWFNHVLSAGSQAVRRNDGEFAYEASGQRPQLSATDIETEGRAKASEDK